MHRLIQILLFLVLTGTGEAHLGNENNTEVRVYADRMQVVVRTSIPLAWRILGDRAPADADEAGKAAARPLLAAAASGLFQVTEGGRAMETTRTDCLFEVENDVAFVLIFPRPHEWPVEMKANFLETLTNLDTGTIRVFDFTASRFNSDLEPLVEGVIHQGNPSLSFSLGAAAIVADPEPRPTPAVTAKEDRPEPRGFWVFLIAWPLLVAAVSIRRIRRSRQ